MNKFDEEYDQEIKNTLDVLQSTPQRDEKVAAAGRQRFMQQVDSFLARGPLPVAAKASPFSFLRQKSFASIALSIMIVLVMLIGSGAGVAAASQGTLPGDTLYAVKTIGEDFHLAVTANENTKFDLLATYVERRYTEIDALQAAGSEVPDSTATRLSEQLGSMLQLAANMDDTDMEKALTDLQDVLQPKYQGTNGDQDRLQDQFQVKSMVQIHKTTRDSWDATALGLDDPQEFRNRYMHSYEYAGEGPGAGTGTPSDAGTPSGTGIPSDAGYGPGPQKQTTGTPEETGFGPGPNATATPQATGSSYGPGPNETEQPGSSYGPGGSYGTGTPESTEDTQYGPGPYETEQPGSSYGPGPKATQEPGKNPQSKK